MMALVDNSDDVTAGTENLARCITETGTVCPCRWVVRTAFTYCSACAPANSCTHSVPRVFLQTLRAMRAGTSCRCGYSDACGAADAALQYTWMLMLMLMLLIALPLSPVVSVVTWIRPPITLVFCSCPTTASCSRRTASVQRAPLSLSHCSRPVPLGPAHQLRR